jgi:hypothetical protein
MTKISKWKSPPTGGQARALGARLSLLRKAGVGPMALPVVARPAIIAAARLPGEWPALSGLVSQPVIRRSRRLN